MFDTTADVSLEKGAMKLKSLSRRMARLALFTVVQASVLMLADRVGLRFGERNAVNCRSANANRGCSREPQRLPQAAEVLSKDFAFREAIATGIAHLFGPEQPRRTHLPTSRCWSRWTTC
jgi:hypothetical protein